MAKTKDIFTLLGEALEWEPKQVKAYRDIAKKTGDVVGKTTETVVRVGTHVAGALVAGIATTVRELGRK